MEPEFVLLKQAASEIRVLRNQNQIMAARLEMFDNMMLVLHTEPARKGQGMSPDLAWEIDRFIEKEGQGLKVTKEPQS